MVEIVVDVKIVKGKVCLAVTGHGDAILVYLAAKEAKRLARRLNATANCLYKGRRM
jgi:hypothetical protein